MDKPPAMEGRFMSMVLSSKAGKSAKTALEKNRTKPVVKAAEVGA